MKTNKADIQKLIQKGE